MTTKKKALKALVILASVLLLCLFFARTLQTITTAKIQKISTTRGKLEDKIPVKGEILFSEGEPFTLEDARTLPITVTKVMAKPGYLIKPGDTLFTAQVVGYEEELQKIKDEYDKKVRELAAEVAGHIRLPQSSEHNAYYNQVLKTTDVYFDRLFKVQAAAKAAGVTLPADIQSWVDNTDALALNLRAQEAAEKEAAEQPAAEPGATPAPSASGDALKDSFEKEKQALYEARRKMDAATTTLHSIYRGTGPVKRTGDGIYDYIKKTDGMREEIARLSKKMLTLEGKKLGLLSTKATREGWLMAMELKMGDKYEGAKPAYTLSLPGETPVFRCEITDIKKPIAKGMKATLEGQNKELTITDIQVSADSKKYAIIALDQETITALGGLSKLMAQPQDLNILYKAQRTTTLIPASALRSGGESKYYVFTVQQGFGGMLSNTTYTVKKQDVTVIETSSKLAALEDDLSYVEIADREDRTLSDGQAVMEYVD